MLFRLHNFMILYNKSKDLGSQVNTVNFLEKCLSGFTESSYFAQMGQMSMKVHMDTKWALKCKNTKFTQNLLTH